MKRKKGLQKYCAPYANSVSVAFESNFCGQSVRFNIRVEELENVNADTESDEVFYFES